MINEIIFPFSDFTEDENISTGHDVHISQAHENISGIKFTAKYFTPLTNNNFKVFLSEADILTKFDHKAIAKVERISYGQREGAGLMLEYCENGNLNDLISSKARCLNDPTIQMKIIYGVASALKYIHEMKYVHTSFSTSLVYLNENYEPMIIDFSTLKKLNGNGTMTKVKRGVSSDILFVAPELLDDETKEITEKVDVYSFGIFVYHLLSGELTTSITDHEDLVNSIVFGERPTFDEYFPESYQCLCSMCWDIDPNSRPTFSDIINVISQSNYALPGTNERTYNEYIKKLSTSQHEDEMAKYYKDLEEKDQELESAHQLVDILRGSLEESNLQYGEQIEKLMNELEKARSQIQPKKKYDELGTTTEPIKEKENNKKTYIIAAASSLATAAALSFAFFLFSKKK